MCLVLDGLGFLLDAPLVAAPHHGLDALILSLDAHSMVLDGLVLGFGFHGEVSLALLHHQVWKDCLGMTNLFEENPLRRWKPLGGVRKSFLTFVKKNGV